MTAIRSNQAGRARGWLLDIYPLGEEMILWFILEDGRRLRLVDRFEPVFYAEGPEAELAAMRRTVARMPGFRCEGMNPCRDIWSGRSRPLDTIGILDLEGCPANLARLYRRHPRLVFHSADLNLASVYCYERGIFPTAHCELEMEAEPAPDAVAASRRLLAVHSDDDPWATDYALPPLRHAELWGEGLRLQPRPTLRSLTLKTPEREVTWEDQALRLVLEDLNRLLALEDPDVLWTCGGDALLMPVLFELAHRLGVPLALDREPGLRRTFRTEGRSLVSYGRVLYMAPDHPLFGRWHIDRRNSFWASSTGLDGLVEIIRLCKLPPQRTARRSIGTGLSSLQFEAAWHAGYLIPWKKTQPEGWKTAVQLVRSDRGGLVFQPLCGVYEDVVEIDFASMFPTIMYQHKVSPELIDCGCCRNEAVPGLGYTICEKRPGLISGILRPVVEKRLHYKRLRAAARTEEEYRRWDSRQNALKWILVCCFGYLGYRNARFGRIEAHESTTAFAREFLLQSKELVEEAGFEVLHANVDSFWMRKSGMTWNEIHGLCSAIEQATGLPIAVEGRYTWIVFLPSRQNPQMPVPTRWFGRFEDGSFKYRGIELRRGDTCPLVKETQQRLIDLLREAPTLAAARAMRPRLLTVVENLVACVRTGDIPLEDLAIRQGLSKAADEYRNNSKVAVAARQARHAKLAAEPGQNVEFVVLDNRNRDPMQRIRLLQLLEPADTADVDFYTGQVLDAAHTVLAPLLGDDCLDALAPTERRPPDNVPRRREVQATFL